MIIKKIFTIKREVFLFLLENAFRATPFNVLVAVLVAVELIYSGAPLLFVAGWFFVIVTISGVRWIWIRNALQKKTFHENLRFNLILFFILTFILGISWGVCYPIFLPFLTEFHEYIIILILGGMCVGAIASLSSYLPSYYAYMLPIFMPVIVYNYSFLNFDRFILATTFVLFVFMLLITATLSGKLVHRTFELTEQKQSLIYRLEI